MAVFRNYVKANFFAYEILNLVYVQCFSKCANVFIAALNIIFMKKTMSEVISAKTFRPFFS